MTHAQRPDQVPGHRAARAAGLLPVVPPRPPAPKGLSSQRVSLVLALVFLAGLAAVIALPKSGPVFGLLVVTAFAAVVTATQLPPALRLREYAAGYCRQREWVGMPPFTFGRQNQAGPAGARWDARGLWLLDGQGRVLEPPDPDVLPPGRYPCDDEGRWDTWTGAVWLGRPGAGPEIHTGD